MQALMRSAVKLKPAKAGASRLIDTSHGKVRVLEYGFDSPETAPLFVDMHGGGFVLGSADMDEPMCVYFREQTGAKIISIDYPKAPKHPYPAAVEAVYDIVKHYINNSGEYGIYPENIGIGGHSAGGNLATVICIMAKEKGEFSLKYQILDFPPCDLTIGAYNRPNPKGALSPQMIDMFGACYNDNDADIARSPYISPVFASKEQLSGLPPALLILAGRDSLHDEGVLYLELLREAGVSVEYHEFEGSIHGFTYYGKPDAKKAWKIMADFIGKHSYTVEHDNGARI